MQVNSIQSTNNLNFQRVNVKKAGAKFIDTLSLKDQKTFWENAVNMNDFKYSDIFVSKRGYALKFRNINTDLYPANTLLRSNFKPSRAIIDTPDEITMEFITDSNYSYNLPLQFSDKSQTDNMRKALGSMTLTERVIAIAKHFEEQLAKYA